MTKNELQQALELMQFEIWKPETPFRLKTFWIVLGIFAYTEISIRALLRTTWGDFNWKKGSVNVTARRIKKYKRHRIYLIPPPVLANTRLFYLMVRDNAQKYKKVSSTLIWPYSKAGFYNNWAALKKVCSGESGDIKTVIPQVLVRLFAHNRPPETGA